MKKTFDLKKLIQKCEQLRKNNKKIILSHGVFDLLHVGHIYHFEAAIIARYTAPVIPAVEPNSEGDI